MLTVLRLLNKQAQSNKNYAKGSTKNQQKQKGTFNFFDRKGK